MRSLHPFPTFFFDESVEVGIFHSGAKYGCKSNWFVSPLVGGCSFVCLRIVDFVRATENISRTNCNSIPPNDHGDADGRCSMVDVASAGAIVAAATTFLAVVIIHATSFYYRFFSFSLSTRLLRLTWNMHLFHSLICHYIVACQNAWSSSLFKMMYTMSEKLVFFYTWAKKKRGEAAWKQSKIHRIFTLICTMYAFMYVWRRYSIETSLTADCYHFHTTKKLWPYFLHSLWIFHFSIPFCSIFQITHVDAHHWWIFMYQRCTISVLFI